MKKTPKTTLEQSHSVLSNAKLTVLCFLGEIGFCGFFAALGLGGALSALKLAACFIISALLMGTALYGLSKFTR
ncbi:MAG: hypothetical protein MJ078_07550 [Clostridia bacterium]|nr:hypothetical protein [Clostridia bacterium]